MGATTIEWAEHSINPIRARKVYVGHDGLSIDSEATGHYCEKIGPDCANCYASTLQKRFQMPAFPGVKGRDDVTSLLDARKLFEVIRRRKPTRYFWCDMTDMFGRWVPFDWIDKCFATMALTPQHTHMVLTKRPERALEYFNALQHAADDHAPRTGNGQFSPVDVLNIRWVNATKLGGPASGYVAGGPMIEKGTPWPLPNVWLGCSVGNQATADERIPHLLKCPAAVRFISAEPLLGPVDLGDLLTPRPNCEEQDPDDGTCGHRMNITPECHVWACPLADARQPINWVIVGGESGHNARPMRPDWARDIRDQCQAAGVPFFFKQWGEWMPFERIDPPLIMGQDGQCIDTHTLPPGIIDHETVDGWYWPCDPEHLDMLYRRLGKKASGRMLDGKVWDEMPEPANS